MAWPDITTSGSATNLVNLTAGSFTWTHAPGVAQSGKLYVFIGSGINPASTADCVTGVTYGVNACTKVQFTGDGANVWSGVQLWEYSGTISASESIQIDFSSSGIDWFACAISFDGTGITKGSVYTNTGTGSDPSVTVVDSANGDYCISFLASDESLDPTTQNGTLIAEAEDVATDNDFNGQYQQATGANTVCSWTKTTIANENWIAMGVAIKGPAGGAFVSRMSLLGVG